MSSEDNSVFHEDGKAIKLIYDAYFNKAMTDQVLYSSAFLYDYTDRSVADVVLRYLIGRIRKATS